MKKSLGIFIVLIMVIGAVVFYNMSNRIQMYSTNFFALDTIIDLRINTVDDGDKILEKCKQRVYEIEDMLSYTEKNSDISRINSHAGDGEWIKVQKETMEVLKSSLMLAEMSDGAFDITVAPLVDLWNINGDTPCVPSDDDIKLAQELINYKDVLLNEEKCSVRLRNSGQAITLGAIAKGYIGDEILAILNEHDIKSGVIDLGGNIITVGVKEDMSEWIVGIKKPDSADLLDKVAASDECVVTSGDYERYFEKDGNRYHHILNPKNGYPADSGYRSVTIIGKNSMICDGLSTTCFVLGKEKSKALLEEMGYSAIFCDKDMQVSYIGEVKSVL